MTQEPNIPVTPAKESTTTKADPQLEKYRIRKAFWLAIIGLVIAALLVLMLLAYGFTESKDIVAIVGLFTSVLGTLVGAFFGLQIGSAGKEASDQRANKAEQKSNALLSAANIDLIKNAKEINREAFE